MDIDIFELTIGPGKEYVGLCFKTRGIVYYSQEGTLFLRSYLSSEAGLRVRGDWNWTRETMPASGSFVEVKGVVREKFYAYEIYCTVYSWEYSSVSYEVLIDFLTASTVACTFILLLWSTRVIGASIAFRAYEKRKLARETT